MTASIEISFLVPDTAKAEMLITPSRIFYCFATCDTREDSELPISTDQFVELSSKIDEALPVAHEAAQPIDGMQCHVKISNGGDLVTTYDNSTLSLAAMRNIISALTRFSEDFIFLRGFR